MRNSFAAALLSLFLATAFVTAPRSRAQEPISDVRTPTRTTTASATQIQDALSLLLNLLEQTRKSGDRKAEANLLGAIANSYNALHQQQRAVETFQAARSIWQRDAIIFRVALDILLVGSLCVMWSVLRYRNKSTVAARPGRRGHRF